MFLRIGRGAGEVAAHFRRLACIAPERRGIVCDAATTLSASEPPSHTYMRYIHTLTHSLTITPLSHSIVLCILVGAFFRLTHTEK